MEQIKRFFAKTPNYKIYFVDSFKLRQSSKQFSSFLDFGTHFQFAKIPRGEIWVANELTEFEKNLNFKAAVRFLSEIARTKRLDAALVSASAVLDAERGKISLQRNKKEKLFIFSDEAIKAVRTKEIVKLTVADEEITIWLVDGNLIRENYSINFVDGGHGFIYSFIPKNEIWIDSAIDLNDFDSIVLHETVESQLMRKFNMNYDKAHLEATKAEYIFTE